MDDNRILVVDDEESIRHVLRRLLETKECEVITAGTAEDAIETLAESPPAVSLLDIVLPGMNGIHLLKEIRSRSSDSEVVMMTSHASVDTAIDAIRQGAYDYLTKPFTSLEDVWVTVQRALQKRSLELTHRDLVSQRSHRTREISNTVDRLTSLVDHRGEISGTSSGSHATGDEDS